MSQHPTLKDERYSFSAAHKPTLACSSQLHFTYKGNDKNNNIESKQTYHTSTIEVEIDSTDPVDASKLKWRKRDLMKTAIDINTAFTRRMFASSKTRAEGAPSILRDTYYAAARAALDQDNLLAGGKLALSGENMYKATCKKHNKKTNSVDLGNGAKGHWVGDPNAKFVMLFMPGGGFILPASYSHYEFCFHSNKRASKRAQDFAILVLDYSLVPYRVLPTQLRQCVSALKYLLEDQHRDPRTIIIGGDSAGASLVAALLIHLARPHPKIQAMALEFPLRGALMISPWISFRTETPAYDYNVNRHYLTLGAIRKAGVAYLGSTPTGDMYAEPIYASPEVWGDISLCVGDVLITTGGNELLCDEILIFASKFKGGFDFADTPEKGEDQKEPGKSRVELMVANGEGHDELIIDYMGIAKGKGKSAKAVKQWMADVL